MAMTAAETGHLVLGTLHTTGGVKTIDSILDALPIDLREQTKSFLSQSLNAVVSQVLVKNTDGRGRKAILEIMVMNRAIAKLVSSDQTHQIPSIVQTNRNEGMQLMDQALLDAGSKADRSRRRLPVRVEQAALERYVTDRSLCPGRRRPRRKANDRTRHRRPPEADAGAQVL
jgi:twitching motility protein PilT